MRPLKERTALIFPKGEGRTEQSHKDDCDIDKIMTRALRGQHSPYIRDNPGQYGNAETISFHEANNIVAQGREAFASLPSKIRTRFNNDPGEFMDFIHDEANLDEAIKLGLVKKPQTTTQATPTVAPDAAPTPVTTPTATPVEN